MHKPAEIGRGPTMSMWIWANLDEGALKIQNGTRIRLLTLAHWHERQTWFHMRQLLRIPFHR